jgi:hypothetical protein
LSVKRFIRARQTFLRRSSVKKEHATLDGLSANLTLPDSGRVAGDSGMVWCRPTSHHIYVWEIKESVGVPGILAIELGAD